MAVQAPTSQISQVPLPISFLSLFRHIDGEGSGRWREERGRRSVCKFGHFWQRPQFLPLPHHLPESVPGRSRDTFHSDGESWSNPQVEVPGKGISRTPWFLLAGKAASGVSLSADDCVCELDPFLGKAVPAHAGVGQRPVYLHSHRTCLFYILFLKQRFICSIHLLTTDNSALGPVEASDNEQTSCRFSVSGGGMTESESIRQDF